jgi:hypothetical protein
MWTRRVLGRRNAQTPRAKPERHLLGHVVNRVLLRVRGVVYVAVSRQVGMLCRFPAGIPLHEVMLVPIPQTRAAVLPLPCWCEETAGNMFVSNVDKTRLRYYFPGEFRVPMLSQAMVDLYAEMYG